MEQVIRCFRELLDGRAPEEPLRALEVLAPIGTCDGYWHDQPGFSRPRESAVR